MDEPPGNQETKKGKILVFVFFSLAFMLNPKLRFEGIKYFAKQKHFQNISVVSRKFRF